MPVFLENVSSVLDLIMNGLGFIAAVVSVITLIIFMVNKYSKALKEILSPCGMGFWPRLRTLVMCRKSQIKKRAFIEYAIVETGGFTVNRSEWNAIINGFKAYYSDSEQGELSYTMPNCTLLIYKEFSDAIARYFKFFSDEKVKKVFGIQDERLHWVITLHIEEAYATPTCLLTGLLARYDENWEEFIKRYVSTAYITEDNVGAEQNVLSNELYFTFAWLLWGPSYELEYRNYWAGLCQLSFGDESNSIPAVADTETSAADNLKKRFTANEERRYGALISADLVLYDKKPFYAALRSNINPSNAYFYDKIEKGELAFGAKIKSFAPCLNYKSKKYYSTAYVWLLFELEDDEYAFKPEKSVAFFEHANLADNSTYEFLISTLIDKSLKHFESIYRQPENAGRRYRFVCAMNDKIAQECVERFRAVMSSGAETGELLKGKIEMEPKHTPAEVFASYDEFFTPSRPFNFVEVSCDDPDTISDLGQFYTDVYLKEFPDENERETFDNFLHYLRQSDDAYRYHVVLAKDDAGKVVGGCVFDYFRDSNAGVVEFLAVRNDLQSRGIGSLIYTHVVSVLSEDAQRLNKRPLEYVCCEIDSPENTKSVKHLHFWNKNNFRRLDFRYVQPALSAGKEPVTGLWLVISPQRTPSETIPPELVLSVVGDYMRYAMGIEDPETSEEYRAMKRELSEKEAVGLKKIIDA